MFRAVRFSRGLFLSGSRRERERKEQRQNTHELTAVGRRRIDEAENFIELGLGGKRALAKNEVLGPRVASSSGVKNKININKNKT